MCKNAGKQVAVSPVLSGEEERAVAAMVALTAHTDQLTLRRSVWLLQELITMTTIETPVGSPRWIAGADFLSAATGEEETRLALALLEIYNQLI